jgi:hypothetical protein
MTYPNSREKTFAKNMNQWYLSYLKQMEKIFEILLPLISAKFSEKLSKIYNPKSTNRSWNGRNQWRK